MAIPKPNEGDIIEGIFALALALYIADGKVQVPKLNRLRTRIEPSKFAAGAVRVVVAERVKRQHGKYPPDVFTVIANIRLKASVTSVGFGKEYKAAYYDKLKDYGDLAVKTAQIVATVNNAAWARRVNERVNVFLKNNTADVVEFEVTADGIAGEASGGTVKGDVNLHVYGLVNGRRRGVADAHLAFSLKSNSQTVANLSPYEGMLKIAKHMSIDWDAETRYAGLRGVARTPAEKKQKFKWIRAMYADLVRHIKAASKKPRFTQDMLQFLSDNLFGSDMATVVDIRETKVKEIVPEVFTEMAKYAKLTVKVPGGGANVGGQLVFHDTTTGADIFQLRLRAEEQRNFGKFYLEVKPGVYAKAVK
jgi:hypothetical protein